MDNATCERLIGTLRLELLGRSLIFGEEHLRAILAECPQHSDTARPHQGINHRVPSGEDHPPRVTAGDFRTRPILRKPIVSGLINEYARAASRLRRCRSSDQNPIFWRHRRQC